MYAVARAERALPDGECPFPVPSVTCVSPPCGVAFRSTSLEIADLGAGVQKAEVTLGTPGHFQAVVPAKQRVLASFEVTRTDADGQIVSGPRRAPLHLFVLLRLEVAGPGGAIRTLTPPPPLFFYYGIHSLMFGGYPATAIGYTPTAIGYPPTAIGCPPTAIGYPPTAIGYTPTAIGYPPTAIGYPPAAIGYPPAAIVGRIGHSEFFFFISLRHPLSGTGGTCGPRLGVLLS